MQLICSCMTKTNQFDPGTKYNYLQAELNSRINGTPALPFRDVAVSPVRLN